MPLSFGDIQKRYVIRKIGGDEVVKKHLQDLGLTQGSIIQIIAKNAGSVIVRVKETRIALGFSMANKIMIEEENG